MILRWTEAKRNKAALKLWRKAFVRAHGVVKFINKTVEVKEKRIKTGHSDLDISRIEDLI